MEKSNIQRKWKVFKFILFLSFLGLLFLNNSIALLDINNLPQEIPDIEVDSSGKLKMSIPIELFPGEKSVEPDLSLNYFLGNTSGNMGIGWDLTGIPSIKRSPDTVKFSSSDEFISSLSGKLIYKNSSGNYIYYRNDPETFFLYRYDSGNDSWIVKDKNGNSYVFQTKELNTPGRTRAWYLSEYNSKYGGSYSVEYDSTALAHGENKITSISYANRKVLFTYNKSNPGYATSFSYIDPTYEKDLLTSIRLELVDNPNVYREYNFDYTMGEFSKYLLTKISRQENTGSGKANFKDLSLTYTPNRTLEIEKEKEIRIEKTYSFSQIPYDDKTKCIEGEQACLGAKVTCAPGPSYLGCESKRQSDTVKCSDYTHTWRAICWAGMPTPNNTISVGDIEGDGKLEILRVIGNEKDNDLRVVSISNLDGDMQEKEVSDFFGGIVYRSFYTFGFGDVDGDGKTDFVYSDGYNLKVMFSNGTRLDPPVTMSNVPVPLARPDYFTDVNDSRWKGSLIDINGDSKLDYVVPIDGNNVVIYLSRGLNRGYYNGFTVDIKKTLYGYVPGIPGILPENPGSPPTFMDVTGDGIPELTALENNKFTIIKFSDDLKTTNSPEEYLASNYGVPDFGDDKNRYITDLNGDGKPDIIIVRPDSIDVLYFTGNSFQKYSMPKPSDVQFIAMDPLSSSVSFPSKNFTDMDGDGHPDLIDFHDGFIRVFRYVPESMVFSSSPIFQTISNSFLFAMDINGDRRSDLICLKADREELLQNAPIYGTASELNNELNKASVRHTYQKMGSILAKSSAAIGLGLITGNPLLAIGGILSYGYNSIALKAKIRKMETRMNLFEFLKYLFGKIVPEGSTLKVISLKSDSRINFLTSISDNFRSSKVITYSTVYDEIGKGNTIINYGSGFRSGDGMNLPNVSNDVIVKSIKEDYGDSFPEEIQYSYNNPRIFLKDKETSYGLGYEKITQNDIRRTTKVETIYHQNLRELAGAVKESTSYYSGGNINNRTVIDYEVKSSCLGGSLTLVKSISSNTYKTGILSRTEKNSKTYDSCGNEESDSVIINDSSIENKSFSYTNRIDFDNYLIGIINLKSITKNGLLKEKTKFDYNSSDLPDTITGFTGTEFESIVSINYDENNLPKTQKDPMGNISEFEYDPVLKNHIIATINPLKQKSEKKYNTETGLELSSTDPNANVISNEYDEIGRLKNVIYQGSNSNNETYEYNFTISGHSVTKKQLDDTYGYIEAVEFFDKRGRSIRKESPIGEDNKLVELFIYDELGRLEKKSEGYMEGVEEPVFTINSYNIENDIVKITHPDGSFTSNQPDYSNRKSTSTTYSSSGDLISNVTISMNAKEEIISREIDGKTIRYNYDKPGTIEIYDPENGKTTIVNDALDRKISQTDENSGTTKYKYDLNGNLIEQIDARGIKQVFTYDELNRLKSVNAGDDLPIRYTYDTPSIESGKYSKGRLTKIEDETGITNFSYDIHGNIIHKQKVKDEYKINFTFEYDSQKRVKGMTYPDGTTIHTFYSPSGHGSKVTMDSADGTSRGHEIVNYTGPIQENGKYYIVRKTGNNVEMKIEFDRWKKRPVGIKTKLGDGHLESQIYYIYDEKGNLKEKQDILNSNRSQKYEYDTYNRLTKSTGFTGEEVYEYSDGGNLKKRGVFTLNYENPSHRHAVTSATSPNTGTFNYQYDAIGNMISRNGESLSYNGRSKLKEMVSEAGEKMVYSYDFNGSRGIKKRFSSSGQEKSTTYYFDELYEIQREPGKPELHTLYFKGLQGEIFSQWTREDAVLVTAENRQNDIIFTINDSIKILQERAWNIFIHPQNHPVRNTITWLIAIAFVAIFGFYQARKNFAQISLLNSIIAGVMSFIIIFTFSHCGVVNGGDKKGSPIWLANQNGVNSNTQSVSNSGGSGSGQGSLSNGVVPVNGMYFLHPDHLGSISMITDGHGNVVSGGTFGGKSNIVYKPYGEIDREKSSGPDITRFKYTGQEEDKETGLYYYKARYYDPMLGRFLQADSISDGNNIFGQNLYMYVNGNPMKYRDTSGWIRDNNLVGAIAGFMLAPVLGISEKEGMLLGFLAGAKKIYGLKDDFNKSAKFMGKVFADSVKGKNRHNTFYHNISRSDFGRLTTFLRPLGYAALTILIIVKAPILIGIYLAATITSFAIKYVASIAGFYIGGYSKGYWDKKDARKGLRKGRNIGDSISTALDIVDLSAALVEESIENGGEVAYSNLVDSEIGWADHLADNSTGHFYSISKNPWIRWYQHTFLEH
ncbi:MAG: VCBS repeat-containing protein [Leptospiraceae bacterium]|nr:VCBS repeat-containing protein [Leptospiraceae bacterium]